MVDAVLVEQHGLYPAQHCRPFGQVGDFQVADQGGVAGRHVPDVQVVHTLHTGKREDRRPHFGDVEMSGNALHQHADRLEEHHREAAGSKHPHGIGDCQGEAAEAAARRQAGAPPYGRFAALVISSEDIEVARGVAQRLGAKAPVADGLANTARVVYGSRFLALGPLGRPSGMHPTNWVANKILSWTASTSPACTEVSS